MNLLNPVYLWSLLALAIPIAIHLWSKRRVKVIKVGSTKFLEERDPKQISSIKLNERLLLAMRLLILAIVTLILVRPQIRLNNQKNSITYLIEPSLLADERMEALVDTLPSESLKILKEGFPDFEENHKDEIGQRIPNYWQLAKEMELLNSDSIVVFANAFSVGIRGARPEIKANVRWIILDPSLPDKKFIRAFSSGSNVNLLSVATTAQHLTFEKEVSPVDSDQIEIDLNVDSLVLLATRGNQKLKLHAKKPAKIGIFYEDDLLKEMEYIQSAFKAIGKYLDDEIDIRVTKLVDTLNLTGFDKVVWLSESPFELDLPAVVFRPDGFAKNLLEPGPSRNIYYLTENLNSENIIDEHLADDLIDFLALNSELEKEIESFDKRVVDLKELNPKQIDKEESRDYSKMLDLSSWLWFLLAGLLIAERMVAKKRRQ